MKTMTPQEIASTQDERIVEFPVPEWGEDVGVRIRAMDGATGEAFLEEVQKRSKNANSAANARLKGFRYRLYQMSLVDNEGNPLFDTAQEAQECLQNRQMSTLNRILEEIMRINNLGPNAVETTEGNS